MKQTLMTAAYVGLLFLFGAGMGAFGLVYGFTTGYDEGYVAGCVERGLSVPRK